MLIRFITCNADVKDFVEIEVDKVQEHAHDDRIVFLDSEKNVIARFPRNISWWQVQGDAALPPKKFIQPDGTSVSG